MATKKPPKTTKATRPPKPARMAPTQPRHRPLLAVTVSPEVHRAVHQQASETGLPLSSVVDAWLRESAERVGRVLPRPAGGALSPLTEPEAVEIATGLRVRLARIEKALPPRPSAPSSELAPGDRFVEPVDVMLPSGVDAQEIPPDDVDQRPHRGARR